MKCRTVPSGGGRWEEASQSWEEASQSWEEASQSWEEASQSCEEASQSWEEASQSWEEASQSWEEASQSWEEASQSWEEAMSQGSVSRISLSPVLSLATGIGISDINVTGIEAAGMNIDFINAIIIIIDASKISDFDRNVIGIDAIRNEYRLDRSQLSAPILLY
ncbi:hypothetical protein Btru_065717 [Bulinus truncatus]|nr:hypothetical protein Btru_065717 [Bulinus truncatus]